VPIISSMVCRFIPSLDKAPEMSFLGLEVSSLMCLGQFAALLHSIRRTRHTQSLGGCKGTERTQSG
jgi:hypothetical protein